MCYLAPPLPITDLLNDTNTSFFNPIIDFNYTKPNEESSFGKSVFEDFKYYSESIIIPIINGLGIIGNGLSLVVLFQRKLCHRLDKLEKSATVGLISLALADMLFCMVGFPMPFMLQGGRGATIVSLYYRVYKDPLLNIFSLLSTWVTVLISMERSFAISWPIQARWVISVRRTVTMYISLFVITVGINMPLFFRLVVRSFTGQGNCTGYYIDTHAFLREKDFWRAYKIGHGLLATFLPIVLMLTCNIRLIRELRESQKKFHGEKRSSNTTKITQILVIIIVLFLTLVCPSNLIGFFHETSVSASKRHYYAYQMVIHVCNLCVAINFSINFLLYSTLSKPFRTILCQPCKKIVSTSSSDSTTPPSARYQLVEISANVN